MLRRPRPVRRSGLVPARRRPLCSSSRRGPARRSANFRYAQVQALGEGHSASGSRGAAALKKRLSLSARAASQLPRAVTMDTACQRASSGLAMLGKLTPMGAAFNTHPQKLWKIQQVSRCKPTRAPSPLGKAPIFDARHFLDPARAVVLGHRPRTEARYCTGGRNGRRWGRGPSPLCEPSAACRYCSSAPCKPVSRRVPTCLDSGPGSVQCRT